MQTAIETFLDEMKGLAEQLGNTEIARRVELMGAGTQSGKTTLLIVGCSGNGRCSVANLLLGEEGLLPVAPDKTRASLRITYGEETFIARSAVGVPRRVISREELREICTRYATGGLESVTVQVRNEFLSRCDVLVESLDGERSEANWRELVAGVDYVLLVTSAMAALNQRERAFITDVVVPVIGVVRLGVLVNQMDLVNEQGAVLDYVHASFRSLGGPNVLEGCSAATGTARTRNPDVIPLQQVLTDRVASRLRAVLHDGPQQSLWWKLNLCIAQLHATAYQRMKLAGTDLERIDRQIQRCTVDQSLIEKHAETLGAQVVVAINLIIREEYLHHVHQFRLAFAEGLAAEVAGETDLIALRRNLPGYIEAVWQEFLMLQQARSREQISAQLCDLQEQVAEDIRQMLGPEYADTAKILETFQPGPNQVRQLIPQAKGNSTVGTVASALKWAGALTVLIYPPGGGLFLLGEAVGRLFHKDIQAADRKALLAKAGTALENVERQITAVAVEQFDQVQAEMKAIVAQCYADRLEQVRTALEEGRAQITELNADRDAMAAVVDVRCPQMRRQLSHLLP